MESSIFAFPVESDTKMYFVSAIEFNYSCKNKNSYNIHIKIMLFSPQLNYTFYEGIFIPFHTLRNCKSYPNS